jgi:hypothetical protein
MEEIKKEMEQAWQCEGKSEKIQGNMQNAISRIRSMYNFESLSAPTTKRRSFEIQTLTRAMHGFENPQVIRMNSWMNP